MNAVDRPVRVGLIGASIERNGWAVVAHAPALAASQGLTLHAVATSRRESAERSAVQLGAEVAHVGASALIADDDVDLVVVAINVRGHAEIVREALAAGRNVLSEWPLGIDAAQSRELAGLAAEGSGLTAIGLQARWAPAVAEARRLIAEGFLGRPLSATLLLSDPLLGAARLPPGVEYTASAENGVTMLSVPGCHALDPLCLLAGEITELAAQMRTLTPSVTLDSGDVRTRTSDDHTALLATTSEGISVAVHLQSGSPAAAGGLIELRGDEGALRIATGTPTQVQISSLTLAGARGPGAAFEPIPLSRDARAAVPEEVRGGPAENVAAMYAAIASALRSGESFPADFRHAARRHRLVEAALESSAGDSRRVTL